MSRMEMRIGRRPRLLAALLPLVLEMETAISVLLPRNHFILDAYENPELYTWLLRHVLASRRAAIRS